jgi:hypothetical protein
MTALAQPQVSTPEARESVALTVYNQNFAVVREVRPLDLDRGRNVLRFEGVPQRIDPTSLSIRSLTHPGTIGVREQNYQYDLVGTQALLDKAVGERVRLVREIGGQREVLEGVLISQPGQGRILRLDDGRILIDPQGEIQLLSLPGGLVSRPSLLWLLDAERGGRHQVEASYTTEGLGWRANYVAVLDEAETSLDLTGWVTLDNQSGAGYEDARLQLMAGEVRREQPERRMVGDYALQEMMVAEARAPQFEQEAFFEYHLYTLGGTTTIANRETKQIELLSADDANVRRQLIVDAGGRYGWARRQPGGGRGTNEVSAAVVVELDNTQANNMGMPLPAGVVRLYKADTGGQLQFLGEDRIGHTPRGEEVRLYVGNAFDVVAERRVVSNERVGRDVNEQTVEVEVRNRKETAAEVTVVEPVWGDWSLVRQSHEHETIDAYTIAFPLTLGAGETATVRYTVRVR